MLYTDYSYMSATKLSTDLFPRPVLQLIQVEKPGQYLIQSYFYVLKALQKQSVRGIYNAWWGFRVEGRLN